MENEIKEKININLNDSNETNNFNKWNFKEITDFLLKAALSGTIICNLSLIVEHPLDSVKVQWQADVKYKNSKDIIKKIYKEKGILGFYRGFLPSIIRRSCKNFYRWPLVLYLPNFFKINTNFFPKWNSDGLNKIQTGLFLANFETLFVSPMERLKVYFMTYTPKINNSRFNSLFFEFIIDNKGHLFQELYRGLEASLYRSNFSWVSFLYLEYEFKRRLLDYKGTNELKFFDLLLVSTGVMVGNLASSKYYN